MDWAGLKQTAGNYLKKYRLVTLILAAGLLLMTVPEKTEAPPAAKQAHTQEETELQQELARILSRIRGVGKVEVLLTESRGEEILYQTDIQQSQTSLREDTVILSGSDREEEGLVRQVLAPVYQGAVIVCQGAGSPKVKLAVVEAVMAATGLSSHQITVLEMK